MYLTISRLIELTFLGFKSFPKRFQILPCSQINDETLTALRFHPVRLRGNNLCVKCALSFGCKAHYPFLQRSMDEIIPIRFNHLQQSTKNNLNIDWSEGNHKSNFRLKWLRDHCYTEINKQKYKSL